MGGNRDGRRLAAAPRGCRAESVVVIAAWAVRSARLMAAVGHPISLLALVPIVSFANTINNLTPASSGEALRAVILRRRHGVPYGHSTAVILVERLWAIWIMAVSAGAAAVGHDRAGVASPRHRRLGRGDRRQFRACGCLPARAPPSLVAPRAPHGTRAVGRRPTAPMWRAGGDSSVMWTRISRESSARPSSRSVSSCRPGSCSSPQLSSSGSSSWRSGQRHLAARRLGCARNRHDRRGPERAAVRPRGCRRRIDGAPRDARRAAAAAAGALLSCCGRQ